MNSETKLQTIESKDPNCNRKKNEYRKLNLDSNNTSVKQQSESELIKAKDSNILTVSNLEEKQDGVLTDNLKSFEQKYKHKSPLELHDNTNSQMKDLVYIDSVDNQNKK